MLSRKNADEIDPLSDPDHPRIITLENILEAKETLSPYSLLTPIKHDNHQKVYSMQLFLKLESLQHGGSYKVRGLLNAFLHMSPDQKKLGVVMSSAGNGGICGSYYAAKLEIPMILVMPSCVSLFMHQKCLDIGSKVVMHGQTLADCQKYARMLAKEKGLIYVNCRDHPAVIAGYGTLGLEILDQLPSVDAVIMPVGGGGLLAGVSAAIKARKPNVLIYGAQPEKMPAFHESIEVGEPVTVPFYNTIADDIAVTKIGVNAFATCQSLIHKILLVNEDALGRAMLHLMENERLVVEGAGVCPLAAVMSDLVPELKSKNVVCILSGANIDPVYFTRCLQKGLAVQGRRVEFVVRIKDDLRSKSEFFQMVKKAGFNVMILDEEHKWLDNDVYQMELKIVIETKNMAHALELKRIVERKYQYSIFENEPFNDKRTCPCYIRKILPGMS